MTSVRKLIEDSIRIINEILHDESIDKNLRLRLLRVREILFKAEVELIALHKRCSAILREALSLAEYLDVTLIRKEGVRIGLDIRKAREKLLEIWDVNQVLSHKDIESMVGSVAEQLIDEMIREGKIRISKVEWNAGEVIVYYKRVV